MRELKSLEEINEVIKSSDAALLYVSAPNCNVCDALKPKVDSFFAKEFPKIKRLSANIANVPELGGEFQIFSAPAILIFFEGKEFVREGRNVSLVILKDRIAKIYNLFFKN